MRKLNTIISICVTALFLYPGKLYSNETFIRTIETKDMQLGQMISGAICQDDLGKIWIGTRSGLFSYNGYEFTPYDLGNDRTTPVSFKHLCTPFPDKIHMIADKKLVEYDIITEKFRTLAEPVNIIEEDRDEGKIWCAYKNTIKLFDGKNVGIYCRLARGTKITSLYSTGDGQLLVGTYSGKVLQLNKNKVIVAETDYDSPILSINRDSRKNIWICTNNKGLFRINKNGESSNYRYNNSDHHSLSSNDVRTICEDNAGNIWIGTMEGLNVILAETGEIDRYSKNEMLPNNSVWDLFKDRQGTIWGATYFGGIFNISPESNTYRRIYLSENQYTDPILSQILEDKHGIWWIASEGNGLMRYDPDTGQHSFFKHSYENKKSISHNNIKRMLYDEKNDAIWICTHLGGICRFDIRTQEFHRISDKKHPELNRAMIRDMVRYGDKYIVAQERRLYLFDPAIESFKRLLSFIDFGYTSLTIHDGKLWCGGSSGLYACPLEELEVKEKKDLHLTIYNSGNGLSSKFVTNVFEDSKDNLWIGYSGMGISCMKKETGEFIHFNPSKGDAIGNMIASICESPSGYIYAATDIGLSQIDLQKNCVYQYRFHDGFPLKSMFPGDIHFTGNGDMLLSGINGIIAMKETELSHEVIQFGLNFSDLKINNNIILPDNKSGIIDRNIAMCEELKLDYNQNTLEISLLSDNYIRENAVRYEHKMEGFDKNWVKTPEDRKIRYTNLPAGHYTLKARGKYLNSPDTEITTQLKIRVRPPVYLSWYAIVIYILLFIAVVYALVNYTNSLTRYKMRLVMERKEKQRILETNKAKLNFFTNISHEFRTPLTLILAQIQMLNEMVIPYNIKIKLDSINKNASRMQDLITELLDFSRQESKGLKLEVSNNDISALVQEIFESFLEYANYRGIRYSIENNLSGTEVWCDAKQMQKVLGNLISNAFKYTQKDGEIKICVNKTAEEVIIDVYDTGRGMSKDDIEKIFDCYYQVENLSHNPILPSSGIGLALTKAIMNAHHGKITVSSEEGSGSQFSIHLKLGREHFMNDSNVTIITKENLDLECCKQLKQEDSEGNDLSTASSIKQEFFKSTILIVEDNEELLNLLKQMFANLCNVISATNGLEGYRLAKNKLPDLIISDVSMPIMSGYELCSKIKNDFETCHIPVILLTAYTSSKNQLEGMKSGADDYITKPFNTNMLLVRCNNILQSRKILKEKYKNEIVSVEETTVTSNSMDQQFLNSAISVVENHIFDEEFDSKAFAQEMLMSQTSLYNKLKAITGLTRREFILKVKLKSAAKMLKEHPDTSIAEVAYTYKFCNPKYFTKCFKEQFGVLPTEYRKQNS